MTEKQRLEAMHAYYATILFLDGSGREVGRIPGYMPPMTMVFQVKDRALLDKVKPGDKVKFAAEEKAGAYIVTSIDAAK